ncbi:MAG: hypothetical protein ACYDH3_00065 [Candidatus Aminicenantales bacterium]
MAIVTATLTIQTLDLSPGNFFAVTEHNNKFYFHEDSETWVAKIKPGVYSIADLGAAIAEAKMLAERIP